MENTMVGKWALVRRNELVDLPERIIIHKDFLGELSEEEFEYSFRQIHELFYQMYTDMAKQPERFDFPLYGEEGFDYFSKEAREVRTLPWRTVYLLLELFAWGEFRKDVVVIDMTTFRKLNQVKKADALVCALEDYGFVFTGTRNGKLPPTGKTLEIGYPDNRNVMLVLSLIAKKVMNTQLKNVGNFFSNRVAFENGFISWNYKLLEEGAETCSLAEGCAYVADKMHNNADRAFVVAMDKADNSVDKQKVKWNAKITKVTSAKEFAVWSKINNDVLAGGFADIHPEYHYPICEKGLLYCYIAYDGNLPVAIASIMNNEGVSSLEFVATVPKMRRKGFAKAVCERAVEEAFADGAKIITVRAANLSAGKLYEKIGFKAYNYAL